MEDDYIVRELQAPAGYMQNTDDLAVSRVDESGNEQDETVLNVAHKQMGEIPTTGARTEMILYTASAIGFMTVLLFLILGGKKKKDKTKSEK